MLQHPPLIKPNPGDPITSEAWANIIDSIKTLYDDHNKKISTLRVQVLDKKTDLPVKNATVTVADNFANPSIIRSGRFVGATLNIYLVDDLPVGDYEMQVEAPGFSSEQREFGMTAEPDEDKTPFPVKLTPVAEKNPMPNLFGKNLSAALAMRASSKFQVTRIITTHGQDLATASLSPEENASLVVNQVPEAGTPIAVNASVVLLVSAKPEVQKNVKVPNVVNLTYTQAKAALESVGLKIAAPEYFHN